MEIVRLEKKRWYKEIIVCSLMIFLGASNKVMAAGNEYACVVLLCLQPGGENVFACADPLGSYFAIEKYVGKITKVFSEPLTKAARKTFLKQCKAPNMQGFINSANERHGALQKSGDSGNSKR